MDSPTNCLLCGIAAPRVACDGCVTALGGRPELLATAAEVVAVPFVPVSEIDRKHDFCNCGKRKSVKSAICRVCSLTRGLVKCGHIKKTGVCDNLTKPGRLCHRCRRFERLGEPVPVVVPEPPRFAEASACMASILVSMARRQRGEVRA